MTAESVTNTGPETEVLFLLWAPATAIYVLPSLDNAESHLFLIHTRSKSPG